MSLQIWSIIIISAAAVVMVILEKLYPYTKGQKVFREGFFNDIVLYSIVQSYFLGLIIFGILDWIKFNTNFYDFSLIGNWPVWIQVLFFVVTHDFYIYWFHRLQHKNKILWRTHEAHHSPRTVDWLSGARSHSFEILINQTVEFAPIILLGAAPEVALYKGMISAVWGMFIHSNIDVRLGKLQYFLNGPEMHRWHHSDDGGREFENNYGTKLAVWDWIFGTAFFPNPEVRKPIKFGLTDTPNYPLSQETGETRNRIGAFFKIIYSDFVSYIRQHIFAFRKFRNN